MMGRRLVPYVVLEIATNDESRKATLVSEHDSKGDATIAMKQHGRSFRMVRAELWHDGSFWASQSGEKDE